MKNGILENFSGIKKNTILKDFTTYKIGGPARYFFEAKTEEDLISVLRVAKESKIKTFILGGGSNLLISDKGFNGLVIKISLDGIDVHGDRMIVGAGAPLPKVAYTATENGFSGLEWAAGVPGTIGGAIYGHAQAFGTKISDIIESVRAIDINNLELKNFNKQECNFSLKNSVFKEQKKLIIVSANLFFKKKDIEEIKRKVSEYLKYRQDRHPGFPSAGSTFVNPEVKITNKKLLEKFPELKGFNEKGVIPSGYLIEKTGLQGKKIGNAQISEKHANFIINLGEAKAKDIVGLIKLAQKKVEKVFGIKLEPEVQFVNIK